MSGDAVKAYTYLMAESWLQEPRATLPDDDAELASMARVTLDKWMQIKTEVLQHYKSGQCNEHKGRLYQDRLLEESRKSENKQRLGNKNAKRSRIKHKLNTAAEYETETETEVEKNDKKKSKVFTPPNIIDVAEYCKERGKGVDPERWYDHYTSNGWKVGPNKMKDWKAAVRTWEKNEYNNTTKSGGLQYDPAKAAKYAALQ